MISAMKELLRLPQEIIERIALYMPEKYNVSSRNQPRCFNLIRRRKPNIFTLQYVLSLSSVSKDMYNIIWNNPFFWKQLFEMHFSDLEDYRCDHSHFSMVRKATTKGEYQCSHCKYFCTTSFLWKARCGDESENVVINCDICKCKCTFSREFL